MMLKFTGKSLCTANIYRFFYKTIPRGFLYWEIGEKGEQKTRCFGTPGQISCFIRNISIMTENTEFHLVRHMDKVHYRLVIQEGWHPRHIPRAGY